LKKIGGKEVWLEMEVKDALFIYLSEYITFMTPAGVKQSQKSEKFRKRTNRSGNRGFFEN